MWLKPISHRVVLSIDNPCHLNSEYFKTKEKYTIQTEENVNV